MTTTVSPYIAVQSETQTNAVAWIQSRYNDSLIQHHKQRRTATVSIASVINQTLRGIR